MLFFQHHLSWFVPSTINFVDFQLLSTNLDSKELSTFSFLQAIVKTDITMIIDNFDMFIYLDFKKFIN
jgi:hypothetical protein